MFLQQPKAYVAQDVGSWWVCERVAGVRCFWDGGVSRGHKDAPWANEDSKDQEATGLWGEDARPIKVSEAVLNKFPCMPLDGILTPNQDFAAFGTPPIDSIFADRDGDGVDIDWELCQYWIRDRAFPDFLFKTKPDNFQQELMTLKEYLDTDSVYLVKHVTLSSSHSQARAEVQEHYDKVVGRGGLGLLMRDPVSEWTPGKSNNFLEYLKGTK